MTTEFDGTTDTAIANLVTELNEMISNRGLSGDYRIRAGELLLKVAEYEIKNDQDIAQRKQRREEAEN
ncbi:MAG: hypothetical protein OXG09_02280 [Chloroflexi bacterium]|nr:hypothetical protein [Chloroflexota bacterium]